MESRAVNDPYPRFSADDGRQDVRISIVCNATIFADELEEQAVRITDCTARGCRIETRLAVTVGTFVNIKIPQFTAVPGWVAWRSPEAIGIDFSQPMPNRMLGYLIERKTSL